MDERGPPFGLAELRARVGGRNHRDRAVRGRGGVLHFVHEVLAGADVKYLGEGREPCPFELHGDPGRPGHIRAGVADEKVRPCRRVQAHSRPDPCPFVAGPCGAVSGLPDRMSQRSVQPLGILIVYIGHDGSHHGIQFGSSTVIGDNSAIPRVAPTCTIRVRPCLTVRLQGGG